MKRVSKARFFRSGCAVAAALILAGCALVYFLWYKPQGDLPLAESLDLPTLPAEPALTPKAESPLAPAVPQNTAPLSNRNTPETNKQPLCGSSAAWTVLLVGTDQQSTEYLYGLADAIRVARIDFTRPQVNVVALPRNLIVNNPARLDVQGPILLNQAYLFGAPGMGHYQGSGDGAGALAETIQYNFGVTPDHYVVANRWVFIEFIDAIGGIEVDLPTYVDDRPRSYFPPGKQTLNGKQAINLVRARWKYSDLIRIDNQTLVVRAIFARLRNPAVWSKIPSIHASLKDSIITDVTPSQISSLLCLLTKMESSDIVFYSPSSELIQYGWDFIPTMSKQMQISFWDQKFTTWVAESLLAEKPGAH
jgi:LCP family protein required for cell wall assembly